MSQQLPGRTVVGSTFYATYGVTLVVGRTMQLTMTMNYHSKCIPCDYGSWGGAPSDSKPRKKFSSLDDLCASLILLQHRERRPAQPSAHGEQVVVRWAAIVPRNVLQRVHRLVHDWGRSFYPCFSVVSYVHVQHLWEITSLTGDRRGTGTGNGVAGDGQDLMRDATTPEQQHHRAAHLDLVCWNTRTQQT